MTLHDWIEQQGGGEISRLVRVTGCAASSLHNHLNGQPIGRYETAKKISDATDGAVSIADLCESEVVRAAAAQRGRLKDDAA